MKNKNIIIIIGVVIVIVGVVLFTESKKSLESTIMQNEATDTAKENNRTLLEGAYVYNPEETDTRVQLINGHANLSENSESAGFVDLGTFSTRLGSAIITTTNFNYGGSGVFVYLSAFDATQTGYRMSSVEPLGDRVRVENITVEGERTQVTYYDYGPEQSMADEPNKKIQRTFKYADGKLTPVK